MRFLTLEQWEAEQVKVVMNHEKASCLLVVMMKALMMMKEVMLLSQQVKVMIQKTVFHLLRLSLVEWERKEGTERID